MTTQEAIDAYLEAVSAVYMASKDPAVTGEQFDTMVAERDVLRRELRDRMLGLVRS